MNQQNTSNIYTSKGGAGNNRLATNGDNFQNHKSPPSRSFQDLNDKSFQQTKRSVAIKDSDLDNYTGFKHNAKLMIQEELKQMEQLATQPTNEARAEDNMNARDSAGNYTSYDFTNFMNSPQQYNTNALSFQNTQRQQNFYNTAAGGGFSNSTVKNNNLSSPQLFQQTLQSQHQNTDLAQSQGNMQHLRLSNLAQTLRQTRARQASIQNDGGMYNSQLGSQNQIHSLQNTLMSSPTNEANKIPISFPLANQAQNLQQQQQQQSRGNLSNNQSSNPQLNQHSQTHLRQLSNTLYQQQQQTSSPNLNLQPLMHEEFQVQQNQQNTLADHQIDEQSMKSKQKPSTVLQSNHEEAQYQYQQGNQVQVSYQQNNPSQQNIHQNQQILQQFPLLNQAPNILHSQQQSQSTNQTSVPQIPAVAFYSSSFGPMNPLNQQQSANQLPYNHSQNSLKKTDSQNNNGVLQSQQFAMSPQSLGPRPKPPPLNLVSAFEQKGLSSLGKKIIPLMKQKDQGNQDEQDSKKDDSLNLNFQPSQILKIPKAAPQQQQDSNFINQQDLDELNRQKPNKFQQQRSGEIVQKLIHFEDNELDNYQLQQNQLQQQQQLPLSNTDRNGNLILHYESSIHSNAMEDDDSNNNILSIEKNVIQNQFQFTREVPQHDKSPSRLPVVEQLKKSMDSQQRTRFSVDSPMARNYKAGMNTSIKKEINSSANLRISKHYQPYLQPTNSEEKNKVGGSSFVRQISEDEVEEASIVQSEMNQEEKDQAMIRYLETITYMEQDKRQYNPLQIPPDWGFAKRHAMSRATARPLRDCKDFCPCCGYVIERKILPFSIDTQQLNFLGSGYPLFYNFIIYCIFMLFALFMISGGYNLFTNYLGNYCLADEQELDSDYKKRMEILGYKFEDEETICHKNIFHTFSLANKKDKPELFKVQSYLNLFVNITMMVILMFFRRNQRQIDMEIDASLSTPQDYTIMVKNIPTGIENIDYKKELTTIFQYHSVPGKILEVDNINFIYNISDLIDQEHELKKTIKQKQEFLKREGGFEKCDHDELHKFDHKIEEIEEKIQHLEKEIPQEPKKFAGVAFVSFSTEQMKKDCLKENVNSYWESISIWWHDGKKHRPSERDLMWGQNKLLIEEAPEPDDVDWEFIHIPTRNKIFWRLFCFLGKIVFMSISFISIYAIAKFQSHLIEHAYEEIQHGKIDMESYTFVIIKSLSFVISAIIVLFNKFGLAEVFHYIADSERWSTKTKLNISFADSLSLGLFLNSAIITYVVEILYYKNYYGPGGFIYTESWVFIWNSILPPLVWIINPYQMYKESQRKKQLQLAKQKMCFLTQEEANVLMEDYDYIQGKRYADIMKTMWFTFLYAPCIPLGNFFSMFNLVAYYYIDKYNILRRSTVKENLSKEVSLQMTENLEYIIVFFALGNFTFSVHLFNTVEWSAIIMLAIGLIYAILPMQDLNEYLFHIEDLDEEIKYNEAKSTFKTDYDRCNPITKKESINKLVSKFQKGVNRIKGYNKIKNMKMK